MKILDCTLRDGGYYTNWDFDKGIVNRYLRDMEALPIDYLELGYRSAPMPGYLGEYFYCPVELIKEIRPKSTKKLAIILNEKDVRAQEAESLLIPVKEEVDMVRMAIDPGRFDRALVLAKAVRDLGFEVAFNLMYMSNWSKYSTLMDLMPEVKGLVDYLYMVDSFGGVFPEDVKRTIELVRSKVDIPLGFHGHDNLEMALANTLAAVEEGVEIVDATMTGMGRGAGNLKTELLLTVLNSRGQVQFDYNALSSVVDDFSNLQKEYEWGTTLPYMVSGANSLPQKQVMEWVSKRYYSFNSIIRALDNQSRGVEDNQKLPALDFESEVKFESALIIGGGPTAVQHAEGILAFLKKFPHTVVIHASSRNAVGFERISNPQFFCLVGNEGHRMEEVFGDVNRVHGKCVLPPFPRKMGTYIPKALESHAFELPVIDFTEKYKDSHTALALQIAIGLNVKYAYTVGYDGYGIGSSLGQKEQDLIQENEWLFDMAKQSGLYCSSLTPTGYQKIEQATLYSLIA